MARLARAEVFRPDEIAIVHVMNRTVRRCYLLGTDTLTGKNYDYRQGWVESELTRLSAGFGIDLLAYAVLSNHFHLVLRSRPDVVATWSDREVARRWLILCPKKRKQDGWPVEPTEKDLKQILSDRKRLKEIRLRLSDISWWMRLLSQNIAQRANREDKEVGKFWQARFRAVRLLDETALLACAAYVDLNPIRAAMAQTLETSQHTSVRARIEALQESQREASETGLVAGTGQSPQAAATTSPLSTDSHPSSSRRTDSHLSPLTIDEATDPLGPCPSQSLWRASDKGFLPMSLESYLQLLDWTARQIHPGKSGLTPEGAPPVLERLGLTGDTWSELARNFGRLFYLVAGRPHVIDSHRSTLGHNRYRTKPSTRQLLSAS